MDDEVDKEVDEEVDNEVEEEVDDEVDEEVDEDIFPPCVPPADVRWLEGLCSLTVGTDYQKRDTTYKGQISIRIRSNIGKPGEKET